jgi:hypothetical protein
MGLKRIYRIHACLKPGQTDWGTILFSDNFKWSLKYNDYEYEFEKIGYNWKHHPGMLHGFMHHF